MCVCMCVCMYALYIDMHIHGIILWVATVLRFATCSAWGALGRPGTAASPRHGVNMLKLCLNYD